MINIMTEGSLLVLEGESNLSLCDWAAQGLGHICANLMMMMIIVITFISIMMMIIIISIMMMRMIMMIIISILIMTIMIVMNLLTLLVTVTHSWTSMVTHFSSSMSSQTWLR